MNWQRTLSGSDGKLSGGLGFTASGAESGVTRLG
jgi:hypothetical protein